MSEIPISDSLVARLAAQIDLPSVGKASIREIVSLVDRIEKQTGIPFIRMEMGVPGLPPPDIGTKAEIEVLGRGVASVYPPIDGVPALKHETSRFLKLFLDIEVDPSGCIPTCGSMQGSYISFLTLSRCDPAKDTVLFIDPCFPVHKQQCRVLDLHFEAFDIYDFRGTRLRDKLLTYLDRGRICSILYSNPNNPAWFCLAEDELGIIGELAETYDFIVLEDLAYFGMDFRKDYSSPGRPPFQPTVARYTSNYILFISASKVFSYAGQRIGLMSVSDRLWHRRFPSLQKNYGTDSLAHALLYGSLYAISAGTAHSAQLAVAAIMKAMNDGTHNFLKDVRLYGDRAAKMKELFISSGFRIVYDTDLDVPVADGFYFTITYPGFTGARLLEELLLYGISTITLDISGSTHEGLRVCVSQVRDDQMGLLEQRLELFRANHQ